MQSRNGFLTSLLTIAATAFLAFSAQAADPSGTWTWTTRGRDGAEGRKSTLKLKVEGDKLTGTLSSPGRQGGQGREIAIEDGKVQGEEISFAITREFNGNKMTQKFSGKVSADTIKGKMEFDRNGQTMSRDWEAKRETEKK